MTAEPHDPSDDPGDDPAENFSRPPGPGKDEMNFAEFPIALLTDKVPKGQKSIKFEDTVYDPKKKRTITRRRIIEGSEEYGLPTATDDAVVLALIQLTKRKGNFSRREVEFTRLELIRMLGWADEGKNFDRIKLSLLRIANVTYTYDNAWWDARRGAWTTKAFHIIDTVQINDGRASDRRDGQAPSRVVWGEVVFESFQTGFLRNIDFQLCMRLEHPTALRMYRFLGKRFHLKPDWTFDLKELAYDYIGLGRNYEGGMQIVRKLYPAIKELEDVGFLEALGDAERFQKKGQEWSIRFVQKVPALPALPAAAESAPGGVPGLVAELTGRGVTPRTAADLVLRHPDAAIRAKVDVFDWLAEGRDRRVAKSPSGYLVKSIEDDFAAPAGFVPRDERRRREEARESTQRQADEARRVKLLEEIRQQDAREAADAHIKQLSPSARAELEEKVLAGASEEARQTFDKPVWARHRETLLLGMMREYVQRMLSERAPGLSVG